MADAEREEEARCVSCGALNVVVYRYSDFEPTNQERETGECVRCGARIASAKCLSISTRLVDAERDTPHRGA